MCERFAPRRSGSLLYFCTLASYRRLDLAAQLQAAKFVIIGLQETRLAVARALGIGLYHAFSAAANKRGQGGIELCVRVLG